MTASTHRSDEMNRSASIRVLTGARLHFGLLDTGKPFGGVGVMIQSPSTELHLYTSDQFFCEGHGSDRVADIADRLRDHLGWAETPKCHIRIKSRPPTHSGLGTGTQLAMAAADGLTRFCNAAISPDTLARQIADRGKRSAVGVHGYLKGGLIYEASDSDIRTGLNPIRQRIQLPSDWTVVIARSDLATGAVSGGHEQNQFAVLGNAPAHRVTLLNQIVTNQIIPSAAKGDFDSFVDSVQQYNYQSGLLFSDVQGGPYNGQVVTECVQKLLAHGARGVGQSSWGPSVFAWFRTHDTAKAFIAEWPYDHIELSISRVLNKPRTIEPA